VKQEAALLKQKHQHHASAGSGPQQHLAGVGSNGGILQLDTTTGTDINANMAALVFQNHQLGNQAAPAVSLSQNSLAYGALPLMSEVMEMQHIQFLVNEYGGGGAYPATGGQTAANPFNAAMPGGVSGQHHRNNTATSAVSGSAAPLGQQQPGH